MNCVFCQLTQVQYENETIKIFKALNPEAPVHYLIVPKVHIENFPESDFKYLQSAILGVRYMVEKYHLSSYRLVMNNHAPFQTVFHAHLHLLSNKLL